MLTSLAPLAALPHLDTLNVSSNRLASLDGLDAFPVLTSLQVSPSRAADDGAEALSDALALQTAQAGGNSLATLAALECLPRCALLSSVDVTHNGLDGDGEALLALLAAMPALRALYLSAGNPVASAVRPYRKRVIAAALGLVYLDERPVFDAERRGAEAWVRGGEEAEKAERDKLTVRRKTAANRRQISSHASLHRTGGEEGCDARQLRAHHCAARGCAGASRSRSRRARCVLLHCRRQGMLQRANLTAPLRRRDASGGE